jgi:hypothetical protein
LTQPIPAYRPESELDHAVFPALFQRQFSERKEVKTAARIGSDYVDLDACL